MKRRSGLRVPARPSLVEPLRWTVFRVLERLVDLRGRAPFATAAPQSAPPGQRGLWVFASTIGELNATGSFLRALHKRLEHLRLVLITDRALYTDVFAEQFPTALVFLTEGHTDDARRLRNLVPPALLVIAEIPCRPADAPCRFSYAFLRTAKQAGAVACLVNGWVYGYAPGCRMDRIERALFGSDFVRQLDSVCVQDHAVASSMIAWGADPARVRVTGNIKFDAMRRAGWTPELARSRTLLKGLAREQRPILVAGCVTDYSEQCLVLDAFVRLRAGHADALLVLAPRHPEVADHMVTLARFMAERGLSGAFRSAIGDRPLAPGIACLVLDTMGELRDFYAVAAACYVGVDHNVLEPLAFEKLVAVGPGWDASYPSYPVYHMLREAGGVAQVSDAEDLARTWRAMLDDGMAGGVQLARVREALRLQVGAGDRCMAALDVVLMAVADGNVPPLRTNVPTRNSRNRRSVRGGVRLD